MFVVSVYYVSLILPGLFYMLVHLLFVCFSFAFFSSSFLDHILTVKISFHLSSCKKIKHFPVFLSSFKIFLFLSIVMYSCS